MTSEPERDPGVEEAVESSLRALLGGPSLSAETRVQHLHRLRERAATLGAPGRLRRGAGQPRRQRVPGLVGAWAARLAGGFAATALVVVLGAGAVVAASADSLPGSLGYGAKRLGEQAALSLRADDAAASRYLLVLAERRLHEAERLAGEGAPGAAIGRVLGDAEERLGQARERGPAGDGGGDGLEAFTARAAERLEALITDGLPAQADDRARQALARVAGWLGGAEDGAPGRTPPGLSSPGAGAPGSGRPGAGGPGDGAPVGPPAAPGPPGHVDPPGRGREPGRPGSEAPGRPGKDPAPGQPGRPGQPGSGPAPGQPGQPGSGTGPGQPGTAPGAPGDPGRPADPAPPRTGDPDAPGDPPDDAGPPDAATAPGRSGLAGAQPPSSWTRRHQVRTQAP